MATSPTARHYGKIAPVFDNGRVFVAARGGIGNFFLIAGLGFVVVGAIALAGGGLGGSIVGATFLGIGVIWALVALGLRALYGRMKEKRDSERQLFETGTRATATVESVETTGMVLNNINQQIVLTLRVEPRGAAPFVHTRKLFVPFNGIPRTGDVIEVAYDPADTSKVALAIDWRSDTAGGQLLISRSPASAAPPAPGAAAETGPERVIEQLERLNRLKEEGVLSDAEFEAQKAKVLAGG
jgi:hypothetical protein